MVEKSSVRALRGLAALSLCLVFGLAGAQEDEPAYADPPDRAARLSFLEGDVSLQPAGEDEWAAAIVNRPLTTGDNLWTDQGARAEIQVGQAAVRLDGNTGFSFLNVDDDTIQMRMTAGVINVHVRAMTDEQIQIDTPNLALSLLQPGDYRVEVNEAGDTTVVKVREGEAEGSDGSQHVIIRAQQAVTFRGTERLAAQFGSLGRPDEFDSWSFERQRRDELAASSQTAQYVSPEVTGYEDLDSNGTWSSESEYGHVWTPTHVAVNWSPYQYGRWAWVAPWGWTWIDDAPWGYAPFHYGRWAHVRNRWCWVPGPRHLRPVYAPALVGWVGTPRRVSAPFSFGGVAWFPLGPREVYVPARRFSPRYVERVNVTNAMIVRRTVAEVYNNRATNVTYRNRVVPGAVTAVSRATFMSAERTGDRRVRLDSQDIIRAGVTATAPQIQPVRESRLGMSEAARRNVRVPPQTVVDRQVVVRRPTPSPIDTAREQLDQSRRPQAAPSPERPARTDRPQANEIVRRIQQSQADQERTRQRQQQDRQLQGREQQQQRQVEIQQRQQQQRQEYERAARQREQQQAAAQQTQQRQRDAGRAHAERPQAERPRAERQSRPEPQKPAETKSQSQKQQDYKDQRQ